MNIITVSLLWLALFSCSFGTSESLEKLIESMNSMEDGKIGYDARMIAAWSGLDSEEALGEILDEVLKPGKNKNFSDKMDILRAMRFPQAKIVGIILEKVKDRNTPEDGLGRAFGLSQYYTDDERMFSYLVSFINDTRQAGRRTPMATADYDSVSPRICDVVADIIREGLQKRGVLKPGDPEWGESGGASSYAKADSALTLLKEFLVKNQLMTVEQSLARPKNVPQTSDSLINRSSGSTTQGRELKRPDPLVASTKPDVPWLWIWVGMLVFGGPIIWRLTKRQL